MTMFHSSFTSGDLLVEGIYAGLPFAAELLQHRGGLIGAIARQGDPLRLAPLMLLGRLCPLHKANEAAKLAQQLLLYIHTRAGHQLVLESASATGVSGLHSSCSARMTW